MIRQPQRQAAGTAMSRRLPAPVDGWNARDSYATMGPNFAIFLDNLYPYQGGCMLRKGASIFATLTNASEVLRTLITYTPQTGVHRLFAAGAAGIYEVGAGGSIGAAATSCTNAAWQYENIVNFAGTSYLWLANGVDKCKLFDGTTWTNLDTTSTPALTGITSTDIIYPMAYKGRLYLLTKNSISFYYLPVGAIAGLATKFPMDGIFSKGGYVMAIDSWTVDGGNGPDDYFVVVTSEGEVAVFQGYDPANASTWGLVGLYTTAAPIGRRCLIKLGNELILLTNSGIVPLSKLLQKGDFSSNERITDTIYQAFQSYAEDYGSEFGWQMTLFLRWNMLIVNVPLGSARSVQCVMNTNTGAWCRFTGWDSEAWGLFNETPYFVRNNKVYEAWTGTDDFSKAIIPACKTSFNYLKQSGLSREHIKLMRIVGEANASIPMQMGIATDFAEGEYTGSLSTFSQVVARWDQAIWDQAVWPSSNATSSNWRTVSSIPGRSTALMFRASLKGVSTFKWYASDVIYDRGGML